MTNEDDGYNNKNKTYYYKLVKGTEERMRKATATTTTETQQRNKFKAKEETSREKRNV